MGDKLDKDTALAKVKVLIGNYYEEKGRGELQNSYNAEQELLDEIDEVLGNTSIDIKNIIIEKLELDKSSNWKENDKHS